MTMNMTSSFGKFRYRGKESEESGVKDDFPPSLLPSFLLLRRKGLAHEYR